MQICVIGTGYVGLVAGACFSEIGNIVTCVDTDPLKIRQLGHGVIAIHEPGLESLVKRNAAEGRLAFTTDMAGVVRQAQVFFIAVGTPSDEDGSADVTQVLNAARDLGRLITGRALVVVKSTVPVGTTDLVEAAITGELQRRGVKAAVDVAFNPEFLKEGDAVNDFMRPDRVIVGSSSEHARAVLRTLYAPLIRDHERMLLMGVRDAELTKYAANAMLATRISFMNEIAGICETLGADVERVRLGIGSDSRIGYAFLSAGCGYGGSCFPKDMRALIRTASAAGYEPTVLSAVDVRNQMQKRLVSEKIRTRFGDDLKGLHFGLWGLAFKPGTDDMREASSVALLGELLGAGATVSAYDPAAMKTARRVLPAAWFRSRRLRLTEHQYDAVIDADALVLVTEWEPFRQPDFGALRRSMRQCIVFDGRNQYDPDALRGEGFEYFGIGRVAGRSDVPASQSRRKIR